MVHCADHSQGGSGRHAGIGMNTHAHRLATASADALSCLVSMTQPSVGHDDICHDANCSDKCHIKQNGLFDGVYIDNKNIGDWHLGTTVDVPEELYEKRGWLEMPFEPSADGE